MLQQAAAQAQVAAANAAAAAANLLAEMQAALDIVPVLVAAEGG